MKKMATQADLYMSQCILVSRVIHYLKMGTYSSNKDRFIPLNFSLLCHDNVTV